MNSLGLQYRGRGPRDSSSSSLEAGESFEGENGPFSGLVRPSSLRPSKRRKNAKQQGYLYAIALLICLDANRTDNSVLSGRKFGSCSVHRQKIAFSPSAREGEKEVKTGLTQQILHRSKVRDRKKEVKTREKKSFSRLMPSLYDRRAADAPNRFSLPCFVYRISLFNMRLRKKMRDSPCYVRT